MLPLMLVALLGWSLYRRARRSIGRQLVRPKRLWIRVAVLIVLMAIFIIASLSRVALLEALLGGLLGGVALSIISLQFTKFERAADGHYYTPHAYIGMLIVALFAGRLAYRMFGAQMPAPASSPFDQYQKSPLTLAIFGVLVGYYVVYNIGILRKSIALAPETRIAMATDEPPVSGGSSG